MIGSVAPVLDVQGRETTIGTVAHAEDAGKCETPNMTGVFVDAENAKGIEVKGPTTTGTVAFAVGVARRDLTGMTGYSKGPKKSPIS